VIMWVPAAMIESIGGLLALRQWVRLSRNGRIKSKRQLQLERRLG